MNPREQLSLGARLVWRSLRAVALDPLLLVYPVASWLAFVGSAGALLATFTGRSFLPRLVAADSGLAYWLGIADVALALVGGAVLTTLFNVGLINLGIRSLRDESYKLRDGLFQGLGMFDRVILWGVVSSTVGPVVGSVERLDPSGSAVETLLGAQWTSAAFLAAPIVAFEQPALTKLFERGRQLYRKTWGYTEGASLGVDLALSLVVVPLAVVGAYAQTATLAPVTTELLSAVSVVGLLVVLLVRQIAVGVSKGAVYIHATTGRTPTAFTGVELSGVSWGRMGSEE
jgi:hypothetical protein